MPNRGLSMSALALTYLGNPVLREVSQPVRKVNAEIKKLVAQMFETMALEQGVGLAAPQVGINKRVIVIDVSQEGVKPFALINPEIIKTSGKSTDNEGCLSIPGVYLPVTRPAKIKVKARDANDRQTIFEAEGLLARAIQHEIDHLDGKLFVDIVDDKEALEREMVDYQTRMGGRIVGEVPQPEAAK